MEGRKSVKKPALLPIYFKIIGLVTIVAALVTAILVKTINVEMLQSQKDWFRVFTINACILGLLFIAMSKDKIEDEMTILIRLKAMANTFTWAIIYVIVTPFIDLLFKDPINVLTGQQIVLSMLFVYLTMYYLQKQDR